MMYLGHECLLGGLLVVGQPVSLVSQHGLAQRLHLHATPLGLQSTSN